MYNLLYIFGGSKALHLSYLRVISQYKKNTLNRHFNMLSYPFGIFMVYLLFVPYWYFRTQGTKSVVRIVYIGQSQYWIVKCDTWSRLWLVNSNNAKNFEGFRTVKKFEFNFKFILNPYYIGESRSPFHIHLTNKSKF